MKKQELLKIHQLSTLIGQFIRYWGFRNIHGEVWTVVYLSQQPLSGIEIGKLLKVSKALISPALKELETEGLIRQTKSENSKTKRYEAEDNLTEIIHGVLKRREKLMLDKIQKSHSGLVELGNNCESINQERLQTIGHMIQMAQFGLHTILQIDTLENKV